MMDDLGGDGQGTIVPKSTRSLRACLVCGLVKDKSQFLEAGCDNCTFLNMHGDGDQVDLCTTPNFEGLLAMMNPNGSWVAKWQHIGKAAVPGCYAVTVKGILPGQVSQQIDELHIRPYRRQ
eukprot:TRINITY_DN14267_c0_g1_i1.p1 TRINITY_DN14267_c0_g1~~TRINITY_DN14267_c0_g1_i1.p1  ORF type:complete len:121 (-),score=25.94 TRINITY_DN14267_c0_g1_i1:107-469(-)